MPVQLSQHFTLEELTKSPTALRLGIINIPSALQVEAMRYWCAAIGEPIRQHFGPVKVNSFFRSPQLNIAEGGTTNSQHMNGEAGDIEVPGVVNSDLYSWIRDSGLPFDQLIAEHLRRSDPTAGWIHVSATAHGGRRSAISCVAKGHYVPGLLFAA